MTDTEKALCEILNQYCFDWVWNEPLSELRENIKPILLSTRSQKGNFIYKEELIPVPNQVDGPFFMYGMFYSDVCVNFTIPTETWISLETLCNDHNVLMDMYSHKGKVCHKGYTFIQLNKSRTRILIAIQKNMCKQFIDINDMDEVYFTVQFDSDKVNECTVYSHFIPTTDMSGTYRSMLLQQLNAWSPKYQQTVMYINGVESTDFAPSLKMGDYIDVIVDENIAFSFDLDLTDITKDFAYYSEMDKTYKQIIHIPKTLNPINRVITHDTCDIWVRRKVPLTRSVEGAYMHRAAKRGVTNITHNDFGIPLYILDAFRDHLDTQDITLHVVCRYYDKDNTLIRDASFIDLLYTQDDETILTTLKGNLNFIGLDFWKAYQLEQTEYVKMFFNLAELYSVNLEYYVKALGYYHTIVLLASRIATKTISMESTPEFYVNRVMVYEKPPLYKQYKSLPLVYRNGLKLKYSDYGYVDQGDTITISMGDDVVSNSGDTFTTVLYLDDDRSIYLVNPNTTDTFIQLPYTKFKLYEVTTDEYRTFKGVDQTSNVSYKDVTDVYGLYALHTTVDGILQLSYGPDMQDKTYVICNDRCSYVYTYDITSLVTAGENVVIPIQMNVKNKANVQVPIINFNNISVYINGRYLIKDLDFIVNTVYNHLDNVSFKQIVIQTMEYLIEPGTNWVEVILNTDEIDDSSLSFQISGICTDPTPANLWFPTVSLLHIDGQLVNQVTDKGVYLSVDPDKYRQGAPYEVQTSVPGIVREFISKYHTNEDKARLAKINEYFGQLNPNYPDITLLPQSHRIYSTLLNRVLRDIVFGNKQMADDPDSNRIKEQLLDYDYLRELDIVQLNKNNSMYIDYYPSYRQYEYTSEQLLVIKTIISSNLPNEAIRAKADTHK